MALACEDLERLDIPISQWSQCQLARQAVSRGIGESMSDGCEKTRALSCTYLGGTSARQTALVLTMVLPDSFHPDISYATEPGLFIARTGLLFRRYREKVQSPLDGEAAIRPPHTLRTEDPTNRWVTWNGIDTRRSWLCHSLQA
jgi:hypothetical protein